MSILARTHPDGSGALVCDVSADGTQISGSQLHVAVPQRTEIAATAFLLDDSRIVSAHSGLL